MAVRKVPRRSAVSELSDLLDSPEVVALLRGHGVGPGAAQRVARIGERLRQRTETSGHEFAALVDAASGMLVDSVIEGSESRSASYIGAEAKRPRAA